MKFTDSQKLACDISRNIAVTAGAGSGKTSVLVRRYLWCLEQNDYQVRRVVAITFSEKAAGEMLQRIRKDIFGTLESQHGDTQRWENVLEQLPLANISTIHGFCQRLLREFPVEAAVDPNFEVFDEAARHILLNRLLDELIQERAASDDADMRVLAQFWSPLQLRGILRQLLDVRDKSRPWAESMLKNNFPAYLVGLYELHEQFQQRKMESFLQNREWSEWIARIPDLIPVDKSDKLGSRCRTVLEIDAEFRQKSDLEEQILLMSVLREKHLAMLKIGKAWEKEQHDALRKVFDALKTIHARYFIRLTKPTRYILADEINDALEQSSFQAQQALARLFDDAHKRYCLEKRSRRILDFDDLQEAAFRLTQHPDVQPILTRRFDYLMVDEFQDTNSLQWDIIRSFGQSDGGLEKDRFCVVGDEKQSIYKFRGADVSVFSEVRNTLKTTNSEHQAESRPLNIPPLGDLPEPRDDLKQGELIMAENFRSSKELIFFFNTVFSQIFEPRPDPERPFDVTHQHMLSLRAAAKNSDDAANGPEKMLQHPVEFLFAQEDKEDAEGGINEADSIARRILGFVKEGESVGKDEQNWRFKDIAILLRTRTRLKEFEEALRRYEIPFVVAGGIGFYEQQEIYDLANLLRFLADSRQDIALAGVLRSPVFSFSDDQLFYVSAGVLSDEAQRRWNLWEHLRHHAHTPDLIPEEFDASKFSHAYQRLAEWKMLADRIPITHLLRRILDQSGLYGVLRGSERAEQSLSNIEKLLDIARKFENEGFQSLTDFVSYFDELITIGEREGEAQLSTEGMNVVQLMTIHASKGLEFPIVFVPELERKFNYGSNEALYLDALLEHDRRDEFGEVTAGIKGLNPDKNYAPENSFLREILKTLNEEKTDAEMKRLLYVACTRAEDCLILSATLKRKKDGYSIPPSSWLAWLDEIFDLTERVTQENNTIELQAEEESDGIDGLEIPLRMAADSRSTLRVERQTGRSASHSTQSVEKMRDDAERRHEGEEVSPFSKKGPGGILQDSALLEQMQRNLSPLSGPENELFQVSPSTLHLLYQCPRKYYYQEILGMKGRLLRHIAPPSEKPDGAPSYGAKRGTIIHKLFEDQVFDTTQALQHVQLDKLLKSEKIPRNAEERQRLREAIERAREHYAAGGLRKLLADSPQLYREYPFQLKVGQALISGVIDVLFLDPATNVWTILDYKSNAVEESQIEAEIEKHGYNLQMQIYALAVSRLMQVEQLHSILFFTHPGSRYEAEPLSPEKLQEVETSLAEHLRNISENRIAPAENLRECDECDFRRDGICQR